MTLLSYERASTLMSETPRLSCQQARARSVPCHPPRVAPVLDHGPRAASLTIARPAEPTLAPACRRVRVHTQTASLRLHARSLALDRVAPPRAAT